MGSFILKRLYNHCDTLQKDGGEHLNKFLKELYIVPKYISKSHVSASCNPPRGIVSVNRAPGQPVIESGSGITEYPMAGNPEIKRDVENYMGKGLIEGIQMAEEKLKTAGQSKRESESIVKDLYHELGHEVIFYMGLENRDPIKEEGTVIFLEKFWFAYNELSGEVKPEELEKEAIKKAEFYIIEELGSLQRMPRDNQEDGDYYTKKLVYLNNAIKACAKVDNGARPEDLIFSDYLLQ